MRHLGRKQAKHDRRTLRLANYVKEYPAPPPSRDWGSPMAPNFGAMLNDRIGDCTVAMMGHAVQAWTANHGAEITVSDDQIQKVYSAVSGYDPANPATDTGAVMLDVMNYWRQTGIDGHRIEAFVSLDPRNRLEFEAACNLFGGVFLGVSLPLSVRSQTIWDVAPPGKHTSDYDVGSWGGHAIFCPAYSRIGWTCITWGALKTATWEWGMTYTDEAYAALGPEWARQDVSAPNGFLVDQLRSDLAAITK